MWEAIQANRRRSWIVMTMMWVLLVSLGACIGLYFDQNQGWRWGVLAAMAIWTIQCLVAFSAGDSLLLMSAGAYKIQRDDYPMLWNVVEEMKIASMLPAMPTIYVIDDDIPNAFAVGRKPEKAAIAVTAGLLRRLDRDELQGVIAHEIAHIHNLDVRFMTFATVMVGSIIMLSDVFLRGLLYGGGRRRSNRNGGGHPAIMIAVLVVAILAPILAQILYFACSRKREYLADACAARFTRYPPGLASALEKISGNIRTTQINQKAGRALAPMFIVNPLKGMAASGAFSTHPPTPKRIEILRGMAGGAGFADYETAFKKATGGARCIGARTLLKADSSTQREASPENKKSEEQRARAAQVNDLIGRMGGMLAITCPCGVKIKIPPKFKANAIPCVRCGREHAVPKAELDFAAGAIAVALAGIGTEAQSKTAPAPKPEKSMSYKKKGDGWESFKCKCGGVIQLSPRFSATHIGCRQCGRNIRITN